MIPINIRGTNEWITVKHKEDGKVALFIHKDSNRPHVAILKPEHAVDLALSLLNNKYDAEKLREKLIQVIRTFREELASRERATMRSQAEMAEKDSWGASGCHDAD